MRDKRQKQPWREKERDRKILRLNKNIHVC